MNTRPSRRASPSLRPLHADPSAPSPRPADPRQRSVAAEPVITPRGGTAATSGCRASPNDFTVGFLSAPMPRRTSAPVCRGPAPRVIHHRRLLRRRQPGPPAGHRRQLPPDPARRHLRQRASKLSYYNMSAGWNFLPGEVFLGRSVARASGGVVGPARAAPSSWTRSTRPSASGPGARLPRRLGPLQVDLRDHCHAGPGASARTPTTPSSRSAPPSTPEVAA